MKYAISRVFPNHFKYLKVSRILTKPRPQLCGLAKLASWWQRSAEFEVNLLMHCAFHICTNTKFEKKILQFVFFRLWVKLLKFQNVLALDGFWKSRWASTLFYSITEYQLPISFRFLLEISMPNKISAAFSNIYEECHMYLYEASGLWCIFHANHLSPLPATDQYQVRIQLKYRKIYDGSQIISALTPWEVVPK